ncbi:predicted protein [Postia placenta Mad-698-R]|uniref:Uncharacterized protein n=1 Tax=Postia placenta MAD-698-R-SB12 TaxID=670580 RepID=A0A1X6MYM0_9APHY|nr:hypothetical protein POSPLADRAFT_1047538 [Postia placenta MAD-698-R-SB12]EED81732.1 predicted protein [Postia placenta Mad-698-R]OSX61316.1 hypothetical protein POSPLADRAFT_1047538 [Postia placenta MAD-698-R-SB12]
MGRFRQSKQHDPQWSQYRDTRPVALPPKVSHQRQKPSKEDPNDSDVTAHSPASTTSSSPLPTPPDSPRARLSSPSSVEESASAPQQQREESSLPESTITPALTSHTNDDNRAISSTSTNAQPAVLPEPETDATPLAVDQKGKTIERVPLPSTAEVQNTAKPVQKLPSATASTSTNASNASRVNGDKINTTTNASPAVAATRPADAPYQTPQGWMIPTRPITPAKSVSERNAAVANTVKSYVAPPATRSLNATGSWTIAAFLRYIPGLHLSCGCRAVAAFFPAFFFAIFGCEIWAVAASPCSIPTSPRSV